MWANDAVWHVSEEMAFRGRDEIAVAIAKQWESTRQAHHWTSNPAMTVDGDSATARFDVHTEVQLLDSSWIWIAGGYEDRYVKRDGQWCMLSRQARVLSQRAG